MCVWQYKNWAFLVLIKIDYFTHFYHVTRLHKIFCFLANLAASDFAFGLSKSEVILDTRIVLIVIKSLLITIHNKIANTHHKLGFV